MGVFTGPDGLRDLEAIEKTEFGLGLRARLERTGVSRDEQAVERMALEQNVLAAFPELREPAGAGRVGSRRRIPHFPLATLIFQAGHLTVEQLEEALDESERSGRRLGTVLAERGLLRESEIMRLVAEQHGLHYVDVRRIELDRRVATIVAEETALLFGALPLGYLYGAALVAIADPTDVITIESVRVQVANDVRFVVGAAPDIAARLSALYRAGPAAA